MGYTVFDSMFNLLPTMAFVLLIFIIVRSIRQWNQDNHAPRLTVAASVVTKRSHTRYDEDQSSLPIMLPSSLKAVTGWKCAFPIIRLAIWWKGTVVSLPFRERDFSVLNVHNS